MSLCQKPKNREKCVTLLYTFFSILFFFGNWYNRVMNIYIEKADGSRDLFDEKKLRASLRASGAEKKLLMKFLTK